MNSLVNEYLQKSNNDPHQAYNEYIKYHLLSGKQFPNDVKGITDFITASQPTKQNKPKKQYKKPKVEIQMNANEILNQVKQMINTWNDSMQWYKDKKDDYMYKLNHSSREAMRILYCKITNIEYEYKSEILRQSNNISM